MRKCPRSLRRRMTTLPDDPATLLHVILRRMGQGLFLVGHRTKIARQTSPSRTQVPIFNLMLETEHWSVGSTDRRRIVAISRAVNLTG
jgi:hypothetical protein